MINALAQPGSNGAIWGTETQDLDATLVRWEAGLGVTRHLNEEVDVIMTVLAGEAAVTVNGETCQLAPGCILVIPKGIYREIMAGPTGITYLNIHKRKRGMIPNMVRPST